jgi:hypothetical protein
MQSALEQSSREPRAPGGTWLSQRLLDYLRKHPDIRKVVWLTWLAIGLAIVGTVIFVSVPAIGWLWQWAVPQSPNDLASGLEVLGKGLAALFASSILVTLAIGLAVFVFGSLGEILALYYDDDTTVLREAVERGSDEQARVEEELGKVDESGLVLLLRYSRIQLEQYYAIGLSQTQRSFKYGVIAMWIGFTVIMLGIGLNAVNVEKLPQVPLRTDTSYLAFGAGLVIEVISALFLWLYRRSIKQLTYFYDRQMYNHGILMSFRIASAMESADAQKPSASDAMKQLIITKMLERSWAQTEDALPEGKSLMGLGTKQAKPP